MTDILKKYVCLHPFKYLDAQDNTLWACCPSWCPSNLLDSMELHYDILKGWQSDTANDIRKSVYDGTYSHCDKKVCPALSQLINTSKPSHDFLTKEQFESQYNISSIEDLKNFKGLPEEILFGFDRSCNLKCPSCRADIVTNDDPESDAYKNKLHLLNSIEQHFSKSLKRMMITGSGDPFYSKIYRDYLINFDPSKYPKLEEIHIITNGQLLTEKMWNSLNSKQYIKTIEISLDAGTKDTYENITRLNGDWNKLIDNIKFLSKQSSISTMIFSMVVSEYNYKEMHTMYDLLKDIFEESTINASVNYRQIVHWTASPYSIKDITNMSVFDPAHEKFNDFIFELKNIKSLPRVSHNFHHLKEYYE
jgi:wyosine [tRNA(Phe)-imidazoG37] synthetase (radical SAM superfamily)